MSCYHEFYLMMTIWLRTSNFKIQIILVLLKIFQIIRNITLNYELSVVYRNCPTSRFPSPGSPDATMYF